VASGQRYQGLPIVIEEGIEQGPSRWVRKCSEYRLHFSTIGNQMVSCQGRYQPGMSTMWHANEH